MLFRVRGNSDEAISVVAFIGWEQHELSRGAGRSAMKLDRACLTGECRSPSHCRLYFSLLYHPVQNYS